MSTNLQHKLISVKKKEKVELRSGWIHYLNGAPKSCNIHSTQCTWDWQKRPSIHNFPIWMWLVPFVKNKKTLGIFIRLTNWFDTTASWKPKVKKKVIIYLTNGPHLEKKFCKQVLVMKENVHFPGIIDLLNYTLARINPIKLVNCMPQKWT